MFYTGLLTAAVALLSANYQYLPSIQTAYHGYSIDNEFTSVSRSYASDGAFIENMISYQITNENPYLLYFGRNESTNDFQFLGFNISCFQDGNGVVGLLFEVNYTDYEYFNAEFFLHFKLNNLYLYDNSINSTNLDFYLYYDGITGQNGSLNQYFTPIYIANYSVSDFYDRNAEFNYTHFFSDSTWSFDFICNIYNQTEYNIKVNSRDSYSQSQDYQSGYNSGYNTGYQDGYNNNSAYQDGYNTGYSNGYDTGFESGSSISYQDGYDDGYDVGSDEGWSSGYNTGYNDGSSGNTSYTFTNFFFTLVDTPIMYIYQLLSFDIFGLRAYKLLFALITSTFVLFLIKKLV